MKRTILSALALTTALTVIAPTAEAAPFRFGLSQGQSQLNLDPAGSFSKTVETNVDNDQEAEGKSLFFKKKFLHHYYYNHH